MTKTKLEELQKTALKVREHIIRMSTDGGCFIGASLSCTDLIVYLYNDFLNIHSISTSELEISLYTSHHI